MGFIFFKKDKVVEMTLNREIIAEVPINTTEENITEPSEPPVIENNTQTENVSKPQAAESWFLYLMNKTDELIGKEKQKTPRLKLVFVPIVDAGSYFVTFKKFQEESTNVNFQG